MRSEELVTLCDVATTSRRAASASGIAHAAGLDDLTTSEVDKSTSCTWHDASTAPGTGPRRSAGGGTASRQRGRASQESTEMSSSIPRLGVCQAARDAASPKGSNLPRTHTPGPQQTPGRVQKCPVLQIEGQTQKSKHVTTRALTPAPRHEQLGTWQRPARPPTDLGFFPTPGASQPGMRRGSGSGRGALLSSLRSTAYRAGEMRRRQGGSK